MAALSAERQVLIVAEADADVRRVMGLVLTHAGHEVLATGHLADVVAACNAPSAVAAVVLDASVATDIAAAVSTLRVVRPGLPMVLIGGQPAPGDARTAWIDKPFTASGLLEAVRLVIDAG